MFGNLIPKSLFVRTALIVLFVLVASQVISIALFRYYAREPRTQVIAAGFISQLKTVRAALETLPPSEHGEFLRRLREERGFRVLPARDEQLALAPNIPALSVARERLREQIDPFAEIYVRPRSDPSLPPNFVVKINVAGGEFWAMFPRNRVVEQDFTYAWLGWGAAGAALALAAALALVWRVNRPLKALATSARELGEGKQPPPVTEIGPEEVKQVAVAFNQMRQNLALIDQDRANFLAGVSHDLRTPLSRLRLAIEMLPAEEHTRRDIEGDISDINGVIDQFMDFARDESSESAELTDLNLLVRNVIERASRGGGKITASLGELPPTALRPLSMTRLITNLIDNAQKHGGGEIKVSTHATLGELSLMVEDRGPGIPPAQVERLKRPFTRLDSSRSGSSGAGLGLAIVDRIAKLHQGRFDLRPRDGGGTAAVVALKIVEP